MEHRQALAKARRWVIKIGSALLTNDGLGLNRSAIALWVKDVAALRNAGHEVVLVSSGSVAEGMARLGWTQRPGKVAELQAAAALGQASLIEAYQCELQKFELNAAQILLVHDDLSNRRRYLNARSTLKTLLGLGAVPIINENDSVATDEIRFGDNDSLAGMVANLIEADGLMLLTDQPGLYDADPRLKADACLIDEASAMDQSLVAMAGDGGRLGRGGMITKVRAAALAARSGATTVIVGGNEPHVISRVAQGEKLGTLLYAPHQPVAARKQWLAGHLQIRGELYLDDGAAAVLRRSGRSLLPVGVTKVVGRFGRGELVICLDKEGLEVARGLVNYSAEEAKSLMGQSSDRIVALLGYAGDAELIHRDNMVLALTEPE